MAKLNLRRFWDADKFLSISAILISLGTFSILIYQTNLIRKQQYASVLPNLEIWFSSPEERTFKLYLENNGIGPAFIKDIKIHYKGKKYNYDPSRFYHHVIFPHDTIYFISSNVFKGQVIPAGKQIDMLFVTNSVKDANKLRHLFREKTTKLRLLILQYMKKKWRIFGMGNPPLKLDK